jgi:hypothetical protein
MAPMVDRGQERCEIGWQEKGTGDGSVVCRPARRSAQVAGVYGLAALDNYAEVLGYACGYDGNWNVCKMKRTRCGMDLVVVQQGQQGRSAQRHHAIGAHAHTGASPAKPNSQAGGHTTAFGALWQI